MQTILFSDLDNNVGLRIKEILEMEFSPNSLVCCTQITEFIDVIRYTSGDATIAVLAPHHRASLDELLLVEELLNRLKIVLILPDHHPETIALGHSLRPRIVTFADDDLAKLAAILNKMSAAKNEVRNALPTGF